MVVIVHSLDADYVIIINIARKFTWMLPAKVADLRKTLHDMAYSGSGRFIGNVVDLWQCGQSTV